LRGDPWWKHRRNIPSLDKHKIPEPVSTCDLSLAMVVPKMNDPGQSEWYAEPLEGWFWGS